MLQPSANPLRKKITLDNPNDRSIAADQIISESSKLQGCFDRMSKGNKLDDPFKALTIMSEVIRGEADMLSLDIGKLVQDFPDVTSDQVQTLRFLETCSFHYQILKIYFSDLLSFDVERGFYQSKCSRTSRGTISF
jgi:hypothetical protein